MPSPHRSGKFNNQLPTGCQLVFEFWAEGHGPQLREIQSYLDWQPRFGCNWVQSGPVAGLLLVAQLDLVSLLMSLNGCQND